MKKFISIILTIITIISCFSIISGAKENNISYNTLVTGACPTTGNVKVLTIVVTYKDLKPTDDRSTKDIYNMIYSDKYCDYISNEKVGTQEDSLKSFYYRQSLGKLIISGDLYDYETEYDYTHYLFSNYQNLIDELVVEAIENLNIDLKKYDSNNDGYIDSIIVYVRNDTAINPKTKEEETLCGVGVSYCMSPRGDGIGSIAVISNHLYDGIEYESNSTLYHEFFHTFGFSDVYSGSGCNPFSNDYYGFSMGSTVHESGTGGISAAHKIELGWITPIEVDYGEYTINSSVTEENAYVIKIDDTHSFIIEYVSDYNESNRYYDGSESKRGIRVWKVEYGDSNQSYSWYQPWNYIICKVDGSLDTFQSFDNIEELVEYDESIDLYCTYEYDFIYGDYDNIESRTPIDYTYSGYSIKVTKTNEKDCTIEIYSADEFEESTNILMKIINWVKNIFSRIKNIFKKAD